MNTWDASKPPIYGCLTGIGLPIDDVEVIPGLALRRTYVDTFGATMMAFSAPPNPNAAHPAPWAPVRGGFTFEGRVEVRITDMRAFDGLAASTLVWLVAAVLRLRMPTPVRLAVIANLPFDEVGERRKEAVAIAFESAPHQIGAFSAHSVEADEEQLAWLRATLPIAARLYHDERFFRAFSLYDQAQWTPTKEMGTVLVWTAIEILFSLSAEQNKTKEICRALSEFIAVDRPDRDRAYQVIQDLYGKRGRTVHAGRMMGGEDVLQSFRLANVAFQRVLIDGQLPPSRKEIVH